jgi:hypothetical protein
LGLETQEEQQKRQRREEEIYEAHKQLFSKIEVVFLRAGQRIHNLRDSFNVIIDGTIND